MYKLAHLFHAYNLQHLIFAVFERRLIQYRIDCMQFFYIIFAVLVKYHDVSNRHYHFIKDC